jgi:Tol biopolymer transport system component
MVYVANRQLYLRDFSKLTAKPIQGTQEVPFTPFFSYDGKWIGYWSQNDHGLKKISVNGGLPVKLCNAKASFGATWGKDHTILLAQPSGILRIAGSGGTAEMLIKTGQGEQVYGPEILPGGEWVLLTVTSISGSDRWDKSQIVAQSLKSGERKILLSGGCDARLVPTGHLVYSLGSDLFAIPFDADDPKVNGAAIPIVRGVQRAIIPGINPGAANYAFSEGGMLAYVAGGTVKSKRNLAWVDHNGNEAPPEAPPGHYSHPRISPDGTKLALTNVVSGNSDIWIWDLLRRKMPMLTFDESSDLLPTWTPDNKKIIFSSVCEGTNNLFWKSTDGTGKSELLFSDADKDLLSSSLASDGKTIAVVETDLKGFKIVTGSTEGSHAPKPLSKGAHNEFHARISPNGKWIAYVSDESGRLEVYVCTFPDVNRAKWQVATSGGESPIWSRDGQELFYRNGSAVMAVSIRADSVFRAQIPEMLFQNRYFAESGLQWDISPDGHKFLMIKESDSPRKIIVATNWF